MGLQHWPVVGGWLGWGSCSIGLGPGPPPQHPHHYQWCSWWQQHGWLNCFLLSPFCLVSFSAIFFTAFRHLFSSFLLSFSLPPSTFTSGPCTVAMYLGASAECTSYFFSAVLLRDILLGVYFWFRFCRIAFQPCCTVVIMGFLFNWNPPEVIVHIFLLLGFDPCQDKMWPQVTSSERVCRNNFLSPWMP